MSLWLALQNIKTAAITNNWKLPGDQKRLGNAVAKRMDVIVESAVEGVRKPEPKIYELLCERLQVSPKNIVFLDDIGANLKPAAAMGMEMHVMHQSMGRC
jgi:putative hydrolase of the HAD superfamily